MFLSNLLNQYHQHFVQKDFHDDQGEKNPTQTPMRLKSEARIK